MSMSLSRNSSNLPSGLTHRNCGVFSNFRPHSSKSVTVNAPEIFEQRHLHHSISASSPTVLLFSLLTPTIVRDSTITSPTRLFFRVARSIKVAPAAKPGMLFETITAPLRISWTTFILSFDLVETLL